MILMRSILILFFITSCGNSKKVELDPNSVTAPFDGEYFENIEPFPDKSLFDVLKWRLTSSFTRKSWPKNIEQEFFKPEVTRSQSLKVAVINHATVLIQMNGINILTDPQFSLRASPLSWVGPKRVIKPGIAFDDLPPIDAVVISHNHYDHLDIPSLQKLTQRWSPVIYVGLGNKSLLNKNKINQVVEMDWWQQIDFKGLKIIFVPVQHWSARSTTDKRKTLWGGFVIEGAKKVFFAGDTGYGKVFKLIHEKLGSMDLSLIPIGAYKPRSFMKNAHVRPNESVQIYKDTRSKSALGIHFGTFANLTDEFIDEPIIDLKKALSELNVSQENFIAPVFGKTYSY